MLFQSVIELIGETPKLLESCTSLSDYIRANSSQVQLKMFIWGRIFHWRMVVFEQHFQHPNHIFCALRADLINSRRYLTISASILLHFYTVFDTPTLNIEG